MSCCTYGTYVMPTKPIPMQEPVVCDNCELAGYITEEAGRLLFTSPDTAKKARIIASGWHRRCRNWYRYDIRGCDCKHIVGDTRDKG